MKYSGCDVAPAELMMAISPVYATETQRFLPNLSYDNTLENTVYACGNTFGLMGASDKASFAQ
jgi:hypothetical protein